MNAEKNSLFRPASLKSFGTALRKARAAAGMTLDSLAAATGISKPYLAHIETARAPGPPSEPKLKALARALHLESRTLLEAADWLRTPASVRRALQRGETPRRPDGAIDLDQLMKHENRNPKSQIPGHSAPNAQRQTPNDPPSAPHRANISPHDNMFATRQIPLINRVAAGTAGEFGDLSYPTGVADAYVPAPDLPDAPAAAMFAVKISGDSMLPEYREGDVIIVGPGEARDGDDCVVRLGETENFATTFKRIFFERGQDGEPEALRLVPLNPAHAERRIRLEDVTGVYPMIYRLVPRRAVAASGPRKKASEKLKPW